MSLCFNLGVCMSKSKWLTQAKTKIEKKFSGRHTCPKNLHKNPTQCVINFPETKISSNKQHTNFNFVINFTNFPIKQLTLQHTKNFRKFSKKNFIHAVKWHHYNIRKNITYIFRFGKKQDKKRKTFIFSRYNTQNWEKVFP